MTDYIHKEYPKTVGRTEFWKQIKRTVNGKPVGEKEIVAIVRQIKKYLKLTNSDCLLDLGCGNGALASHLIEDVGTYRGVDFSDYLIGIAKEFFSHERAVYEIDSIQNFIQATEYRSDYNKVLIYGVISYLSKHEVGCMLSGIYENFANVTKIFVGNIPNKAKAADFYRARNVQDYDPLDHKSPIGLWWKAEELCGICREIGFNVEVAKMPDDFYGSSYRFDLLLMR